MAKSKCHGMHTHMYAYMQEYVMCLT